MWHEQGFSKPGIHSPGKKSLFTPCIKVNWLLGWLWL